MFIYRLSCIAGGRYPMSGSFLKQVRPGPLPERNPRIRKPGTIVTAASGVK
jgi:hypothetical protein